MLLHLSMLHTRRMGRLACAGHWRMQEGEGAWCSGVGAGALPCASKLAAA